MSATIALEAVEVVRDGRTILRATLSIAARARVAIVGPSGSGKSTLLKAIDRLVPIASGTVRIDGLDTASIPLPELRRKVGYTFQALGLFPHLTVAENVGLGPSLAGARPEAVRDRVDALLRRVSLEPATYRDRLPAQLSGGQAQRVAVARALATSPPILLLDEPFGALDPETRASVQDELLAVCAAEGPTTLIVTHDLGEAIRIAERVVVLIDGEVVRDAAPRALVRDPGDPRIEALLRPARESAAALTDLLA